MVRAKVVDPDPQRWSAGTPVTYLEELVLEGLLVDGEVLPLGRGVILVQAQLHVAVLHARHLPKLPMPVKTCTNFLSTFKFVKTNILDLYPDPHYVGISVS